MVLYELHPQSAAFIKTKRSGVFIVEEEEGDEEVGEYCSAYVAKVGFISGEGKGRLGDRRILQRVVQRPPQRACSDLLSACAVASQQCNMCVCTMQNKRVRPAFRPRYRSRTIYRSVLRADYSDVFCACAVPSCCVAKRDVPGCSTGREQQCLAL